jgi:plastocyanin
MAPIGCALYAAAVPESPGVTVRNRLTHLAALATVAALVLTACGGDAEETVLVDETVEVRAVDNNFQPDNLTVAAGTTIRWTNNGRNDHNVLSEDGADWEVPTEEFLPGDEAERRFTEPGEYRYYCSIHGTIDVGMIGTIVVE